MEKNIQRLRDLTVDLKEAVNDSDRERVNQSKMKWSLYLKKSSLKPNIISRLRT